MHLNVEQIPLDDFSKQFSTAIELSSVALGGQICSVSDEFFAEAHHLLLVEPAPSLKGQFGPKGALFSGWETRRHNPSYDWCIVKLGCPGAIFGFDVDTAHFNGNEAPQVSVEALFDDTGKHPSETDGNWEEILPKTNLGPSSRHLFKIPQTSRVNYVKLNMYPDGGIARFRVYGLVNPVFPSDPHAAFDLAHVFAGGRVVFTSDQHFGVGSNLILPGRGKDMGDGWETKRSRQPGHRDWAIIKLGDAGLLSHIEIDTAHFMGNFPESCEVHAANSGELVPLGLGEDAWTVVLPRTKLGPHRQHQFQLQNVGAQPYTHIRVTIYPDGGIKRVRVVGRRAPGAVKVGDGSAGLDEDGPAAAATATVAANGAAPLARDHAEPDAGGLAVIPALALTAEAFAPFGQVVQAYADVNAVPAPRTTRITGANQGTAVKFHKLALHDEAYPAELGATTGLAIYRCKPIGLAPNGEWEIKLLERHPATKQAFIPMGEASGENTLEKPGKRYLVIVALNGPDDKPDLQSMRAFVASAGQGLMYNMGIWHHPMAVLDGPMDFTCVETQVGDGSPLDCEIVSLEEQPQKYAAQVTQH